MKNLERNLNRKALQISAAAFALILLPRLLLRILGITAGRTKFAEQETGFLVWNGKKGKILFASSEYDPDWDIQTAVPMAKKGILLAVAAQFLRRRK